LPELCFAWPGALDTPTGGYEYDRRVIAALRGAGWRVRPLPLGEGFPFPAPAVAAAAMDAVRALPPGLPVIIDGLALGVLPDIGAALPTGSPLVALVHHPLAMETGLSATQQAALHDSEARALAAASVIVVTSHATAATLRERFGIDAARLVVALPGMAPPAPASGRGGAVTRLLAVGTLSQRKGHDVLVAALSGLPHLDWTLRIVGDGTLDPACSAALREQIDRLGLAARITLTGAVTREALDSDYARADIFVLASHYEGYGMAYAEAMANGLPVIGCRAGAIPEVVPDSAGLLVPPGDAAALRAALEQLIADRAERARLAAGALVAARRFPTWQDTAALIARAVESVT
jgi:hypothetical protein